MVPTDPHSLAAKYTGDSFSRACIFSENEICYFDEFPDDCYDVEYYEWAM